jgi:hypothetical protein
LFDKVIKGDSSFFRGSFRGSDLVKQYLVSTLDKMKQITSKNQQIKMIIQYSMFDLKKEFLKNISKGTQYCNCRTLSGSGIFPGMYNIVQQECSRICGSNSLEAEDLEFEFDE